MYSGICIYVSDRALYKRSGGIKNAHCAKKLFNKKGEKQKWNH
jgi:hypothetical protein